MKTISAKPLFDRLKKRGARAEFARSLNISEARLSNWESRGLPAAMVPTVAGKMGLSVEDYYRLAASGQSAEYRLTSQILPDNEGEKILVLLRTFLDTDRESRDDIIHAAQAIQGDSGIARGTGNTKGRRSVKGR